MINHSINHSINHINHIPWYHGYIDDFPIIIDISILYIPWMMSHDIPFIDDENPHKPASCSGARACFTATLAVVTSWISGKTSQMSSFNLEWTWDVDRFGG